MKIVLITPPHFYLFNTLAVPRLLAYLKSRGHDVEQVDVDMEIYNHLLHKKELMSAFAKIEKVNLQELGKDSALYSGMWKQISSFKEKKFFEYNDFFDFLEDKNAVIEGIHNSVNTLQSKFLSLDTDSFFKHFKRMGLGLKLISLAHYPTRWSPASGISMKYSPHIIDDIYAAVGDTKQNFLIDYYKRYTLPKIIKKAPQIIGISMNHFSQIIPGFTIIKLIKESLPNCHITIGGESVTLVSRFFIKQNKLWNLFESLVVGIGEYTLENLIDALSGNKSLSKVPNLLYKGVSEIKRSNAGAVLNLNDFPTPEFTENRPNPIIPIAASSGCSWAECAFCHYPYMHSSGKQNSHSYTTRSLEKVLDDITSLNKKYNPLYFHFTDTNVPPQRLENIADAILSKDVKTKFFSFMRAEKEFTSISFCEKLAKAGYIGGYFGLESASQETNLRMNKNIFIEDVVKILKNFDNVNIISNLFCMVGFPGETEEEAFKTYNFIKKYMSLVKGEISMSYFHLKYNTPVFKYPEKFGIKKIIQTPDKDFISRFDYEVTSGLTQAQSGKLVEKFNKDLGLGYLGNRFMYEFLKRRDRKK